MFGISVVLCAVVIYYWIKTDDYTWATSNTLYVLTVVALLNLLTFSNHLLQNRRSGDDQTKKA
jgi:hypothetical protein